MTVQHIVYEIWNPITLECIYVGKGNSNRSRLPDHIRDAKKFRDGKNVSNPLKSAAILRILETGIEPVLVEVASFGSEIEAMIEENRLITRWGRKIEDKGPLTNLSAGNKIQKEIV